VAVIYWRSRASKVDQNNVNAAWSEGATATVPEPATA
jgi:hypothetical protein